MPSLGRWCQNLNCRTPTWCHRELPGVGKDLHIFGDQECQKGSLLGKGEEDIQGREIHSREEMGISPLGKENSVSGAISHSFFSLPSGIPTVCVFPSVYSSVLGHRLFTPKALCCFNGKPAMFDETP